MPTHPWYTTGVPAASLIGANVRQIAAGPPSQGDRQGRPYYTTNRPATPVYSRGGACPFTGRFFGERREQGGGKNDKT